jgi:hypothetical protein
MRARYARRIATSAMLLACAMGCVVAKGDAQVMGQKPRYLENLAPQVSNEGAIGKRIFVPGLDEGWVPQGLAVEGEHLLISGYKPTPDLGATKGPCRVFRVEAATGRAAGKFDIPLDACNSHAGGLAYLGDGQLILADTQHLSRIDLPRALAAGSAEGAIETVKVTGQLHGSFAASGGGKEAWTGTWTKNPGKARMYRLGPRFFDEHAGKVVDEKRTADSIPIPAEAQGAAFDAGGNAWVTASRSNVMSKLYRIDRRGNVAAQYDMPMGLEGIAFDASGRLWGVSESGTRKYQRWGEQFNFPFVFEIDVAKLK